MVTRRQQHLYGVQLQERRLRVQQEERLRGGRREVVFLRRRGGRERREVGRRLPGVRMSGELIVLV